MVAKEGEGMVMGKDDIHLPCPGNGCNGNIIFTGLIGNEKYFKCCICGVEFTDRRKEMRKKSFIPKYRRKP